MYFMNKIVLILILFLSFVNAARILCFYPVTYHSHHIVFQELTEKLAHQGHELVVLAPISSEKKLPNVTVINVKNITNTMVTEIAMKYKLKPKITSVDPVTFWNSIYLLHPSIAEAQLNVPEMQNLIKNKSENFDLILIEGCIRASLMISARFKAPVIIVSSFFGSADNYYTIGAAIDPIIFPDFSIQPTWNSTLWKKLLSVYTSMRLRLREWEIEKIENEMIRKNFGEEAPTMAELKKNVQMLLLNVHHVWDSNRPVPPNVIYLGALNLKSPKPLNNDLKTYLDNSEKGVIYMSLGSNLRTSDLPVETVKLIMKVFAALPYDFIWKWDGNSPPGKPNNVLLTKWLPQSDMLYHPKIKAFITHASLHSTNEAIAARVPLIALPVKADQPTNAAKYEQHGIGMRLNIDNLNEEEFKKAILDIAENTSYRDNMNKLARVMKEEEVGALEKAISWIDHIATHGGLQLRPPLPDLSFVEYYMLDVIVAIGLIVLFAIVLLFFLIKHVTLYVYNLTITKKKFKRQ